MANHEANGIAHERVGQIHGACFGAYGTRLHRYPLLEHREHIVPPHDVGFEYLAGAGVECRRSHGVSLSAGGIHESGVVEIVVVGTDAVGEHFGYDCILEADALKSHIPVGDALQQIFAPLAWCAVVDIEFYWLHRLHEFAFEVGGSVARHEAPALHVVSGFHLLLVVAEAEHIGGEVANARRVEAHLHRLLGEQGNR